MVERRLRIEAKQWVPCKKKKLTCAQKKMQNLISVGAEVRKVFELRPPKACRGKIGLKFKFTGLPTFSNTGYSDTVRR